MDQEKDITKHLLDTFKTFYKNGGAKNVQKDDVIFANGMRCGMVFFSVSIMGFRFSVIPELACYICLGGGVVTVILAMLFTRRGKDKISPPNMPVKVSKKIGKSKQNVPAKPNIELGKDNEKMKDLSKDAMPNLIVHLFDKNRNVNLTSEETVMTNFKSFKTNNIEGLISIKHFEDLNGLYDVIYRDLKISDSENGKHNLNRKLERSIHGKDSSHIVNDFRNNQTISKKILETSLN